MIGRVASSPSMSGREVLATAAGAVFMALLMHWPLVAEFGSAVPRDLGDPLAQAWQVAWGGHALLEQPLDLFQSNQYWPGANTLAYSDALLGYAPLGMLGSGPDAAVTRYDALFLFAAALCFAATYLLARELGLSGGAAAVAAIAFAYAPYRLEHHGHLHILSSGGIPLAVFLLVRGQRRGAAVLIIAGWLAATWQLALGFSLGVLLLYALSAIGLAAGLVWWRRGRLRPNRVVVAAHGIGLAIFAVAGFVLSRPYLAVLDELPEARRTVADVANFSGPLWSYLSAAEESTLWGPLTAPAREHLSFGVEQALFPGLTVVLLGLAGLVWARAPLAREVRIFLAVAITVCMILALGIATEGPKRFSPYRVLYEVAPGFEGIRVPGRITTLTTLGLALLAGAGAQRVVDALAARAGGRVSGAGVAVLAALLLFEGSALRTGDDADPAAYRTPSVPAAPAGFSAVRGPVLHLPAGPVANRRYLLWSTRTFAPMVNGRSSVTPRRFERIVRDAEAFPDRRSVARLRAIGLRSVVLHVAYLAATPWANAPRRPVTGLGLRRSIGPELVVYDLRPDGA